MMGGSYIVEVQRDKRCTYNRNVGARPRKRCCHGKAISVTCSECVFVALVIQHAMGMRRVILSSVPCLDLQYFPRTFGTKFIEPQNVCFGFCLKKKKFLVIRRIQRDTVINSHNSSFLSDFNETLIFSTYFGQIVNIKFLKNPSSGSRVVPCGRTDRQTDGYDEANSRFSKFCQTHL